MILFECFIVAHKSVTTTVTELQQIQTTICILALTQKPQLIGVGCVLR